MALGELLIKRFVSCLSNRKQFLYIYGFNLEITDVSPGVIRHSIFYHDWLTRRTNLINTRPCFSNSQPSFWFSLKAPKAWPSVWKARLSVWKGCFKRAAVCFKKSTLTECFVKESLWKSSLWKSSMWSLVYESF